MTAHGKFRPSPTPHVRDGARSPERERVPGVQQQGHEGGKYPRLACSCSASGLLGNPEMPSSSEFLGPVAKSNNVHNNCR